MTRKPKATGRGQKPKPELPKVLGAPLPPFAAPEGASPFKVAQTHATQSQVNRAEKVTGTYGPKTFAGYYEATQNPVWLLISIALAEVAGEVPPLVFKQLRAGASRVLKEVNDQTMLLETVHIVEGAEVEEGILRRRPSAPPPLDLLQVLGWSRTGRNHLQSAARDMRAISMAVAAHELMAKGSSYEDAVVFLAKLNGRTSPETGPSISAMKQMVTRGRKLIAAARAAAKRE